MMPSNSFAKLLAQPCCSDSNIFTNVCKHNDIESPIKLNCEQGRYMLDPFVNENDNFTVDKHGNLIILSNDDSVVTWDKYVCSILILICYG